MTNDEGGGTSNARPSDLIQDNPNAAPYDVGEDSLVGKRIVVTRADEKSSPLVTLLERAGAEVCSFPTIRFTPPADPRPLHQALERIKTGESPYRWIVFTSSTGVRSFFEAAKRLDVPREVWEHFRFAVVGPSTASQLASVGIRVERVIIGSRAEALAGMLVHHDKRVIPAGEHCLLAQADIARVDLQKRLAAADVLLESVIAYETHAEDPEKARPFLEMLDRGDEFHAIAFASPSAFTNFLAMTHPKGEIEIRARGTPLFSIGPTTTNAIRRGGFRVAAQASAFTSAGLVEAIVDWFGRGVHGRSES